MLIRFIRAATNGAPTDGTLPACNHRASAALPMGEHRDYIAQGHCQHL
jgi:hypothetical protein